MDYNFVKFFEITACTTKNTQQSKSIVENDRHVGGPFVRLFAESKSLSRDALEILSASRSVGTGKMYNSHINRSVKFCREKYLDPIQATIPIKQSLRWE